MKAEMLKGIVPVPPENCIQEMGQVTFPILSVIIAGATTTLETGLNSQADKTIDKYQILWLL